LVGSNRETGTEGGKRDFDRGERKKHFSVKKKPLFRKVAGMLAQKAQGKKRIGSIERSADRKNPFLTGEKSPSCPKRPSPFAAPGTMPGRRKRKSIFFPEEGEADPCFLTWGGRLSRSFEGEEGYL